jgi:predicted AlkP superfamily phosphohydrolase/phosphomutase
MNLKVLVVGWDGATFDLLAPWIASGELPNLAGVMREGVHGPLRSVPNMNSGPAWTSVNTGVNPGKHGIYGLVGFAERSYRVRPLNAADRQARTIWQRLSETGKQMVVMNFPMTYPAEPVNGVLVAGGDAPGPRSPRFAHPEGLMDELEAEAGGYILAARLDGLIRSGRKAEALRKLHRMVDSRTRAILYLMRRQPWDLCMVLFTASDSVQHFFWEDLSGGPHQDAILSVFRHLDDTLGTLLAQAGDPVGVIVLSDHGFGPTQSGLRYVNDFLATLGLLAYQPRHDSRPGPLRWSFLQLEKRLGDRTKEWLLGRLPGLYERAIAGLWIDGVDWSATRAFNLAGTSEIWLNLRGRQPQGIVSPGEEYEEVVTLIQRTLGEAVDPATGKPAVRAVHRRTDLYHGPYLDQAPDLLIEWTGDPVQSGLAWHGDGQPVVAMRSIAHRRHPVNGGHREMGILVASGPPFKTGEMIEGASLYDIAPTLLYLLGQPIPTSFDGQLLTGALVDGWLQSHRPRFIDEERDSSSGPGIAISSEDEGKVMGRLRALGYVE